MDEATKNKIRGLRKNSKFAYVGSVNEEGFPQVKCMLTFKEEDVHVHHFSTNTSSKRVQQFKANPKAAVYYVSELFYKGALFTGEMEVLEDNETKARFWERGDEKYYPQGVTDPDYCILRFTAKTVNYYQGLKNETIPIDEL